MGDGRLELYRKTFPKLSELQLYRRAFPQLQLDDIQGDDLANLQALGPNPSISLEHWERCSKHLSTGEYQHAAGDLIELFKNHRFTFLGSGWVKAAVGQIILQDEIAAMEFVKSYRRERRKPESDSSIGAWDALEHVRGPHRKHWLSAATWMIRFSEKDRRGYAADSRAVDRAVRKYSTSTVRQHSCLADDAVEALATEAVLRARISRRTPKKAREITEF